MTCRCDQANRAHWQKHDVLVLDFMNYADTIKEAFADYCRTTVLAEETAPTNCRRREGRCF